MATLRSGVLLKLFRDMESSSSSDSDILPADFFSDEDNGDDPAILQVTGIVPAITDSDLYPDRGFYLQVSDSSHSTYVSLPPGHDDLILSDNLQIGQLILVRRLEASSPVPILHDLQLIPGRHPLPHHTVTITSPATCSTICRARTPEGKNREQHSASTWKMDGRKNENATLHSNACTGMTAQRKELERVSSALKQPMKMGASRVDEESDESDKSSVITTISSSASRSFVSMIPMPKTVRKIWEPNEGLKDRQREDKPILKTRSSTGDLAHFTSGISKGESLVEPWAARRVGDVELKALHSNSAKKRNSTPSKLSTKNLSATTTLITYDDVKWPGSNVLWGSLTFNLVKYGKEVLRKRDSALSIALDALQEACALDKLLGCLSTYSELQASKVDHNPQKVVDKFLDFHEELSRTILATQSLSRTNSSFSQPLSSSLHQAKDASERRKCAASWIKAALKSELSRSPKTSNTITDPTEPSSPDRKSQTSRSRQKKGPDSLSALSALPTLNCNIIAADLAKALQSECNRWFLRFIEKLLDVIHTKKSCCKTNESQIASLLCQLKRVDDWLATVSTKDKCWATERSKESFVLEDDDGVACGRVRRKIYEILLKHLGSAAMALESLSTTDEDKAAAR
ncbi:uncharacterized protein LOC110027210 [Phalaenopsis equestris]|uniref:uncharacterized protein LOC110027210 n=1 Tax=Phalaenopsis equestris TaxID=78828 RepID=UPI0009E5C6BD|nr:uncharacterized protein LOC110027210 [Phalaenopsis equestris]